MTQKNQSSTVPQHFDHTFSTFMMGATVGVLAAFLFGTEQGRDICREVIDNLPQALKKDKETQPVIPAEPLETAHHLTVETPQSPFN